MSLRRARLDPARHQQPPNGRQPCVGMRQQASCDRVVVLHNTTLTQEAHPLHAATNLYVHYI